MMALNTQLRAEDVDDVLERLSDAMDDLASQVEEIS